MRKLLAFLLFLALLHACSTLLYKEEAPPEPVEIEEDYAPKTVKSKGQQLVSYAKKHLGAKYKYGGTTPKGFDCSGFTSFIYEKINIQLPRSSSSQASKGKKVKIQEVKPGDLVFFEGTGQGKITHVAMTVSNTSKGLVVIHSTTSSGVREDNISRSAYWQPKLLFAKRLIRE